MHGHAPPPQKKGGGACKYHVKFGKFVNFSRKEIIKIRAF